MHVKDLYRTITSFPARDHFGQCGVMNYTEQNVSPPKNSKARRGVFATLQAYGETRWML